MRIYLLLFGLINLSFRLFNVMLDSIQKNRILLICILLILYRLFVPFDFGVQISHFFRIFRQHLFCNQKRIVSPSQADKGRVPLLVELFLFKLDCLDLGLGLADLGADCFCFAF